MTTEAGFWKAIDRDFWARVGTDDWLATLAVFADWLRDNDDPRGEPYWIMATLKLRPMRCGTWDWWVADKLGGACDPWSDLPAAWWKHLDGYNKSPETRTREYETLKDAIEAAAAAYWKLGPVQRKKLVKYATLRVYRPSDKYTGRKAYFANNTDNPNLVDVNNAYRG